MVDGIVSFIFFSKSPLWITIGIYNFGGLNFSFLSTFHCTVFRKRAENKGEQFRQLKEKKVFNPSKKQRPSFDY